MADYEQLTRQFADARGIDRERFWRQIKTESNFDPKAYNRKSGATGIAQIIPKYHPTVDPNNPIASLSYASKWMAQMIQANGGGDQGWVRALVSYNWGPGNASQWDGTVSKLPAETQKYLRDVLGPNVGGGGSGNPLDPREWLDPSQLGTAIGGGLVEAVRGWWASLWDITADTAVETLAPPAFLFGGVTLITIGTAALVLRSPPAQAAAGVAATTGPAYVRAAGIGVQALGSVDRAAGSTSGELSRRRRLSQDTARRAAREARAADRQAKRDAAAAERQAKRQAAGVARKRRRVRVSAG